ncbi:MAG: hypothetical protein N838_03995 [Thiohalocapsa sp. PB-PSB1]|nr:MAG: hypothetical protein N838_03995 [Thiohalocapsa sp. PB-PSB1]
MLAILLFSGLSSSAFAFVAIKSVHGILYFRYDGRFYFIETSNMSREPAPSARFRWPVRVYYEDTDALGVVYYANYLKFMERARTEWLRALGFEQDRLRDELGIGFIVRHLEIEFLQPARFNDQLVILSSLIGPSRASFDFAQTILQGRDEAVCCNAEVKVACVDRLRLRPARIPRAILTAIDSEIVHGL